MRFIVRGIPQEMADEVRRTHLSPGYGHPAHLELARGTGPCRCCLRPFVPGREQRLLFTYRPPGMQPASWRQVPCSFTPSIARPSTARDFRRSCARCRWHSKRGPPAVVSRNCRHARRRLPKRRSRCCLPNSFRAGCICATGGGLFHRARRPRRVVSQKKAPAVSRGGW